MSTSLAFGALVGSLLAARRRHVPLRLVVVAALVFGAVEIAIGFSPTYIAMLVVLPFAGGLAMTFTTSAQSFLQLHSDAWVRGRVMGIYTLLFFGGTPLGAPVIGWAAGRFGPRSGLIGGGLATVLATLLCLGVYAATRAPSDDDAEQPLTPEDELEVVQKAAADSRG